MVHDREKPVTTHLYMYIGIRLWRLRICRREISDKIAGNMTGIRIEDFSDLPSDPTICGLSMWQSVMTLPWNISVMRQLYVYDKDHIFCYG